MDRLNSKWSQKILNKIDPNFRHRWELYDNAVKKYLDDHTLWIDCGCGNNEMVKEFSKLSGYAVGVDTEISNEYKERFIKANIKKLPFHKESIDVITLRFVVEHFEEAENYLSELQGILKNNGKIIFITTNILCPIIFIPKFIPFFIRKVFMKNIFKAHHDDVYPAFHKMNSIKKIKKNKFFDLVKLEFISDLNYTRKSVFIILLIWHILTMPLILNKYRTNILVILKKN